MWSRHMEAFDWEDVDYEDYPLVPSAFVFHV
jgi:hypothetical protein